MRRISLLLIVAAFFGVSSMTYADLMVEYLLNEGSGTIASNTVSGSQTLFKTHGTENWITTPGLYGQQFDGSTVFQSAAGGWGMDFTAATVAAWVCVGINDSTDGTVHALVSGGDSKTMISIKNGQFWDSNNWRAVLPGDHIGRWMHLAWTVDGVNGTRKWYIDGVMVQEIASTWAPGTVVWRRIAIGAYSGGGVPSSYSSDSKVDEVQIYNNAISDSDVLALYNAGATAAIPGLATVSLLGLGAIFSVMLRKMRG